MEHATIIKLGHDFSVPRKYVNNFQLRQKKKKDAGKKCTILPEKQLITTYHQPSENSPHLRNHMVLITTSPLTAFSQRV